MTNNQPKEGWEEDLEDQARREREWEEQIKQLRRKVSETMRDIEQCGSPTQYNVDKIMNIVGPFIVADRHQTEQRVARESYQAGYIQGATDYKAGCYEGEEPLVDMSQV